MLSFRELGFDGNFIETILLVLEGQRRKTWVSVLAQLGGNMYWSCTASTHRDALPDGDSQQEPGPGSGKAPSLLLTYLSYLSPP